MSDNLVGELQGTRLPFFHLTISGVQPHARVVPHGLILLRIFFEAGFLCVSSPDSLGINSVDQVGLELGDLPAFAS